MKTKLDSMIQAAKVLSESRICLADAMGKLDTAVQALRDEAMPEIRNLINAAAADWAALDREVRANPAEFVKPRTVTAHGIKFGWEKGRGATEIPDPAKTVMLIKKHFPEQAKTLIDVTETPAKNAIALLAVADLKRIACLVRDASDQVLIRPANGDLDRLVRALVKADVTDVQAAAEAVGA